MYFSYAISLAALLSAVPLSAATDYGYWNLRIYELSTPGGYRKSTVRTEYWLPSGEPGPIVYCAKEHQPPQGDSPGDHETPCNDTSFAFALLSSDFDTRTYLYQIKETVLLDGKNTSLVGTANVTKVGDSGTGFSQSATAVVNATLADAASSS